MELSYSIRLGKNFYLIQGPDKARFPFCNSFLFTGNETVLIDSGIGEYRIREIDRIYPIDILVISHSHPDHILDWHVLENRHILLPKETPQSVHDLIQLGKRFTGNDQDGDYWAEKIVEWIGLRPLREPDGRFEDKEVLSLGGARLEAIHAPGHLRDHYCFLERRTGTLLSTDIDFTGFGPWYGNPEGDVEKFMFDIKRIMDLPVTRICSSHRLPINGNPKVSFNAYIERLRCQRAEVLALCKDPITLDQLVAGSPFFKNRFPDPVLQRIFEKNMIERNLELLVRRGQIEVSDGKYASTPGWKK